MIGQGTHDPYMLAYEAREEAGESSPLDRANAAFERAEQARAIFSEDPPVPAHVIDRGVADVARFARLCAHAQLTGQVEGAKRAAEEAEAASHRVDSYDACRFDGLRRPEALASLRNRNHGH